MNIETDLPSRRVNGRMWIAGQSGNPAGRPVGARGRFSQQFIEDMRASWERHGATVMDRVAVEYPDRYLGIAAHLIPKEVTATIEAGSGVLDLECMAIPLKIVCPQQTIAARRRSWSSSGMLSELTTPS